MNNVRKIKTRRDVCRDEAMQILDEIRQRDDVIAIYGIIETNDGQYEPFGSSSMSRLQTAGALFETAIETLGGRWNE